MIHIGRAGAKLGVFTEEEVRAGLVTGRFSWTDLGWKEGMANWAPLSKFEELTAPPEAPPLPEGDEAVVTETEVAGTKVTERTGLPWDERKERGWMIAFAQTARLVMMNPAEAFGRMRTEGPLSSPLLYNMIGGWLGLIASGVYTLIIAKTHQPLANPTQLQRMFEPDPGKAMVQLGVCIFLGPVIVTVSTMILAGIAHLFLMLAGGANQPYHVTLRVFCFTYGSTQLLQFLPFCGSLIALAWLLVCGVTGLASAHATTTGRAVAAMVLFLAFFSLCCLGIIVALVMGTMGAGGVGLQQLRPMLNQ